MQQSSEVITLKVLDLENVVSFNNFIYSKDIAPDKASQVYVNFLNFCCIFV